MELNDIGFIAASVLPSAPMVAWLGLNHILTRGPRVAKTSEYYLRYMHNDSINTRSFISIN